MRKSLVSIVAVLSLVLVAACGDDDGTSVDAPVGGNPDADPSAPDADPGSTPDAGTPDATPAPPPSAEFLGQVCDPADPACPTDYVCLTAVAGDPGFCSIVCGGGDDETTCSAANGFQGPGTGMCILTAPVDGVDTPFCGIGCGTQLGLDGMCPTDLTCADFDGNGQTDICLP